MQGYKWVYKNIAPDSELFSKIKKVAGSDIVANLLINRGVSTIEDAEVFLNPDKIELSSPFVFPDMQKAVNRINQAIKNQENIVIYGDFDSDGVTSTALLYKTLIHLGAKVEYYIPDRSDEGHGLNRAALCKLISTRKAKLIITVDCGITNNAEVKMAQGLGTDIILTDHHEPLEELPEAFAIINPKTLNMESIRLLAGVGVAYKLAEGLLISNNQQDFVKKIIHLVAIGTVGDVVPLTNENRVLVSRGLEQINKETPSSIETLMELSGNNPGKKITSTVLAFAIVPRINAIGRLADAIKAVEFLVSDNPVNVEQLAKDLNANNKERQQLCDETFEQAEEKIINMEIDLSRDKAIILADSRWHPGIVGLVASRLVEKYYRPAILVSLDEEKKEARCSARSIEGLNIFEVFNKFSDNFLQFGGHSLAGGFTASLEKIEFNKLKSMILCHINSILDPEYLKPELKIELDIAPEDLDENFIHVLDRLAPYGEMNPYPVFSHTNLTLKNCNTMGAKKNHLKIILSDDNDKYIEAIWWQKTELDICPMEKVNVAFAPSINEFNGKKKIQLIIKDLQPVNQTLKPEACHFEAGEYETQWFDHRKESGFKKEFLEYIKSRGNEVSVFAESARAKDIIANIPYLEALMVDRTSIKSIECLVLLDFPTDDTTFINVLRQADPSEVHLFGLINEYDPVELIKKISGMFKYAHKEKNGVMDIIKASTLLAISAELMFSCTQLLESAGVIKINEVKGNSLSFEFIAGANLNTLQELNIYHNFISQLNEFIELKNDYKTKDIELIRQTLDNLEAFQSLA